MGITNFITTYQRDYSGKQTPRVQSARTPSGYTPGDTNLSGRPITRAGPQVNYVDIFIAMMRLSEGYYGKM